MILSFYLYEYMDDFEKSKKELPSNENFYSCLTKGKGNDEEYEYVLDLCNKFEMKTMEDFDNLYFKCDALFLVDVFEKLKNNNFILADQV